MLLTILLVLATTPDAEVARIQEHLRGASALLERRDVSGLTQEQICNRELNAQRLLDYTAAERFPKNRHVPGRIPVFRDEDGTLCAVGALLWASGEHAIVEHIVATRNTATVWQLADEPGLAQWLDAQGLTLAEAARIQPSYEFMAFDITTTNHVVALGACSPPVQLQARDMRFATSSASVSSSSPTTELFSDSLCSTPLMARPSIRFTEPLYFRETTPGRVTLSFSNQWDTVTQEHDILLADGGRIDAGPFDAGPEDAGTSDRPASDAGTAAPADAGSGDAGTLPAAPIAEGPAEQRGCGCGSTDASLLFTALALLGAMRLRAQRYARRH